MEAAAERRKRLAAIRQQAADPESDGQLGGPHLPNPFEEPAPLAPSQQQTFSFYSDPLASFQSQLVQQSCNRLTVGSFPEVKRPRMESLVAPHHPGQLPPAGIPGQGLSPSGQYALGPTGHHAVGPPGKVSTRPSFPGAPDSMMAPHVSRFGPTCQYPMHRPPPGMQQPMPFCLPAGMETPPRGAIVVPVHNPIAAVHGSHITHPFRDHPPPGPQGPPWGPRSSRPFHRPQGAAPFASRHRSDFDSSSEDGSSDDDGDGDLVDQSGSAHGPKPQSRKPKGWEKINANRYVKRSMWEDPWAEMVKAYNERRGKAGSES